eukprot:Tbor_TRINITY_DN5649_c0_g2::TRINITY_DN5649_c0_g2_i1::g.8362::m.8362/K10753/ASF1; histone chaperone ASF1
MPVELSEIRLTSPLSDEVGSPFKWEIELNVIECVPEYSIEIHFIFGCDPESPKGDCELEVLEIEPENLKIGKNRVIVEHDAPDFKTELHPFFEPIAMVFPLLVLFKYCPSDETSLRSVETFLTVGVQVLLHLKDGLVLEELEDISAENVMRKVLMDKYQKTEVAINWERSDKEDASFDSSEEAVQVNGGVTKKSRIEAS